MLNETWTDKLSKAKDYFRSDDVEYSNDSTKKHMHLKEPFMNEWLIAFCRKESSFESIKKNGFKGSPNIRDLAVTVGGDKEYGGYNFAFKVDTFLNENCYTYGPYAFIFQASGLEIHHDIDNENQVIFDASTVKEIIPIQIEMDEDGIESWVLKNDKGRIEYSTDSDSDEDLKDIIKWVMTNKEQYHKHITNRIELNESDIRYIINKTIKIIKATL